MDITILKERAGNSCELCGDTTNLQSYTMPHAKEDHDSDVLLCETCLHAIQSADYSNTNHWRALTSSIWSETPVVQVLAYNILNRLKDETWAQECLESVFLDESIVIWALADERAEAAKVVHKDAYGNILQHGDTVVLIENLNVKGTSYIAPKGTQVKKIRLVAENGEQIEGRINTDTIIILTKFIKKA